MNKVIELSYGVTLSPDDDGFLATFRDLDNVFTWGETEEEALFNAQEALDGTLAVMAEQGMDVIMPSPIQSDEIAIPVSPEVAAPVLLHHLRAAEGKTLAEVARTLNKSYQAYQRMEKLGGNLTLKSLKAAASALGATVEIRFRMPMN